MSTHRSPPPVEPKFSFFGNAAMQIVESAPPRTVLSLEIRQEDWEPVAFADVHEELATQLLATVYINNCPMHFEAYLVDVENEFYDPQHQKALEAMKTALGDAETWSTIQYEDNAYAVIAIPYGKSL